MNAAPRHATLAVVIVLTLAGSGLRLAGLNDAPIRGDEVFTIRHWMRQPLAVTLEINATDDPHPPLAYALFRGWSLVLGGDAEIARFLPALANVLGIPALYALGKRLAGRRAGLFAALLWAIHPYQVWHAQDARNYAIWSALSAAALWLGLRAVRFRRPLDWALYVAAAALAAYTYYLELFVVLALNLYVLIVHRRDRRLLGRWLAAQVVLALLLAPWYLQPRLLSGGGYRGTTGALSLPALGDFLPTLNFGVTTPTGTGLVASAILLALLAVATYLVGRWSRRVALFALLVAALPFTLLALISLRLNVFTPRYILAVVPGFILIVSALATRWRSFRSPLLSFAATAIPLFWVVASLGGLYNYFLADYTKAPNWPAVVAFLSQHAAPGDIIIQAAADEALNYYYDEFGITLDRKQLPANPRQAVEEITALLEADSTTHGAIWRVGQTFPDWPNYGVVERWLAENMQPVRALTIDGLRVEQHAPWQVATDDVPAEPLATFGDVADLMRAELHDNRPAAPSLDVILYWRAQQQTDVSFKVSVQLIGPTEPQTAVMVRSQHDDFPQGGRVDTRTWQPGTIYRDPYRLSLTTDALSDATGGEYVVIVILYDPVSGDRLPVGDTDHYAIGTARVP